MNFNWRSLVVVPPTSSWPNEDTNMEAMLIAIEKSNNGDRNEVNELNELQLALVGGGSADVILA